LWRVLADAEAGWIHETIGIAERDDSRLGFAIPSQGRERFVSADQTRALVASGRLRLLWRIPARGDLPGPYSLARGASCP
jgi:hypothetical protein